MLLNEAVNEYEYSGNIDRKSIGQIFQNLL